MKLRPLPLALTVFSGTTFWRVQECTFFFFRKQDALGLGRVHAPGIPYARDLRRGRVGKRMGRQTTCVDLVYVLAWSV